MTAPAFLPVRAAVVRMANTAAQDERARREAEATADLAQQIEQRKPVDTQLFKRMDFGPGHLHYAVADTPHATTTVMTYGVDRDLVNLTLATGSGEHYTCMRFTAALARAVAAELIAAADSLGVRGAT